MIEWIKGNNGDDSVQYSEILLFGTSLSFKQEVKESTATGKGKGAGG